MIRAWPTEVVRFAVRIEAGLALVMLVLALVVWLSRGASHAMALLAIGFLVPQPFLAWAFWRAAKGLGEEGP